MQLLKHLITLCHRQVTQLRHRASPLILAGLHAVGDPCFNSMEVPIEASNSLFEDLPFEAMVKGQQFRFLLSSVMA